MATRHSTHSQQDIDTSPSAHFGVSIAFEGKISMLFNRFGSWNRPTASATRLTFQNQGSDQGGFALKCPLTVALRGQDLIEL